MPETNDVPAWLLMRTRLRFRIQDLTGSKEEPELRGPSGSSLAHKWPTSRKRCTHLCLQGDGQGAPGAHLEPRFVPESGKDHISVVDEPTVDETPNPKTVNVGQPSALPLRRPVPVAAQRAQRGALRTSSSGWANAV